MRPNAARAWELALERLHLRYRRDRLALVLRGHQQVRVLGPIREGRFLAAFDRVGPPDFQGVIAGGRAVIFDAKCTAHPRFRFSEIADHQIRDLEAARIAGAVSGIALRCPTGDHWLPWGDLVERYRKAPSGSVLASDFPTFDVDGDGWLGVAAGAACR